jgi:hypothetical protein
VNYTRQFEEYHAKNPRVYDRMVEEAREWKRSGNGKLGVDVLVGRIRWIGRVEQWDSDFKINDRYSSFYARLIMAQEPDLRGIFNLRTATYADRWINEKFPPTAEAA